jgi:hypothetical protein
LVFALGGIVLAAVALALVLGGHGTPPSSAAPQPVPGPQRGEAAVTVAASGTHIDTATTRRRHGYAIVFVRNLTDGWRFVRIGRAGGAYTTSLGLPPLSAAADRVPLSRGRYPVSVRRAGEGYGTVGFLRVR